MTAVISRAAPSAAPYPPTRASCQAALLLGVAVPAPPALALPVEALRPLLKPGRSILIRGASGSGKTTLLNALARSPEIDQHFSIVRPERLRDHHGACVSAFGRAVSLEDALACLARAGLADARALAGRTEHLSAGERERLRLARALHACESRPAPVALVVDEFGAALDDDTARAVARTLGKRRPANALLVVATNRDIAAAFAPDHLVTLAPVGSTLQHARDLEPEPRPTIVPGARDDYLRLARMHHRPRPPATIDRVLVARCPRTNQPVGVAVLSLPTLNARWRAAAWPDLAPPTSRASAQRLNESLRCISRVIVHPAWRGAGVATDLVRAALDAAPTPRVEAVAAMGALAPFFERAGMTAWPIPRRRADVRLLDLFDHAGVERWRLATPASALARLRECVGPALVTRELKRWAQASRATRAWKHAHDPDLLARAALELMCERRAFTRTRPGATP